VNILAIEGSDKGLIKLGEEVVGDFISLMLDGLDDLDLLGNPGVMRKHFEEGFGAGMDILGLLGEKVEKSLFMRHKPLQKSWHDVTLP